jgi:hypothetical protein
MDSKGSSSDGVPWIGWVSALNDIFIEIDGHA